MGCLSSSSRRIRDRTNTSPVSSSVNTKPRRSMRTSAACRSRTAGRCSPSRMALRQRVKLIGWMPAAFTARCPLRTWKNSLSKIGWLQKSSSDHWANRFLAYSRVVTVLPLRSMGWWAVC
ncbi:Uncharacterised protein [Mycobacteroides abscessus subsp. bolletii]|nr:Uncharacterised protein [Mycobacteroides abscessus subsp. bolletii]